MNTETTLSLQKPKHIVSLASASVLVTVDINVWTATKQDKEISHEVTTAKKASDKAGRFVKHLLADNPAHRAIINYRQNIYNWLQRSTFDWAGSQRCLPHVNLPRFMKDYQHHDAHFYGLVEAFCAEYPSIISNMAFAQGDMFDRREYPDVATVRSKFRMNLITSEIPLGDFRCQIAQDLADDLFKHYSAQADRIVHGIIAKQTEQLVEVMESIRYCCTIDESVGKDGEVKIRRRKIYDTTMQRALELCDTFKQFNLTQDPKLEEASKALSDVLSGVKIEALRESDTLREKVKTGLDDILSKFVPAPAVLSAPAE